VKPHDWTKPELVDFAVAWGGLAH